MEPGQPNQENPQLSKQERTNHEELQMKSGRPALLWASQNTSSTYHLYHYQRPQPTMHPKSSPETFLEMGGNALINSPLQSFQNIKDLKTEEDRTMTSLDVIGLFMSIDPEVPKKIIAASLHKHVYNITEYTINPES